MDYDERWWRWATDGAIALFSSIAAWLLYLNERAKTQRDKKQHEADDIRKAANLYERLNQIERSIQSISKAQKIGADERKMITRQVYGMRRDLDREYIRQPVMDKALSEVGSRVDGLSKRIDRILEGRQ